jgi:hypothetical protein
MSLLIDSLLYPLSIPQPMATEIRYLSEKLHPTQDLGIIVHLEERCGPYCSIDGRKRFKSGIVYYDCQVTHSHPLMANKPYGYLEVQGSIHPESTYKDYGAFLTEMAGFGSRNSALTLMEVSSEKVLSEILAGGRVHAPLCAVEQIVDEHFKRWVLEKYQVEAFQDKLGEYLDPSDFMSPEIVQVTYHTLPPHLRQMLEPAIQETIRLCLPDEQFEKAAFLKHLVEGN